MACFGMYIERSTKEEQAEKCDKWHRCVGRQYIPVSPSEGESSTVDIDAQNEQCEVQQTMIRRLSSVSTFPITVLYFTYNMKRGHDCWCR